MRPDRPPRQAGLALLETIIALAIFSLAAIAIYDGAATGLAAASTAERIQTALSLARSHIVTTDARPAIVRRIEGDDGNGFHYLVSIVPEQRGLNDIQATVSWRDGRRTRSVTLATKRAAVP